MKKIKLTQGQYALVDNEDYNMLSLNKWYANKDRMGKYYVLRFIAGGKGKRERMHRLLMDAPVGMEVDHINGNTLDNRRSNLRIVTTQQNCFNRNSHRESSSKFRGVNWNKKLSKWVAQIMANQKKFHIGVFEKEIVAAKAYNQKAKELFGEYARLNTI